MPFNTSEDSRFHSDEDASRNVDSFDTIVAGWVVRKTRDDAIRLLAGAGATCGAVYDIADIVSDPQYLARGGVRTVNDPDLGAVRMVGVVPTVGSSPNRVRRARPDALDRSQFRSAQLRGAQ